MHRGGDPYLTGIKAKPRNWVPGAEIPTAKAGKCQQGGKKKKRGKRNQKTKHKLRKLGS